MNIPSVAAAVAQAVLPLHAEIEKLKIEHATEVARLNAQVQALAAEASVQDFIISAVRDLARETDGVTGWHLNGNVASWDEVLPELAESETPVVEATLNEVRAQAIEGLLPKDRSTWLPAYLELVTEHTSRIRKGESQ